MPSDESTPSSSGSSRRMIATWSSRPRSSPTGRPARTVRARRSFCSSRSRDAAAEPVGVMERAGGDGVAAGRTEVERSLTADSSSRGVPLSSRRTGSVMLFLNTYVADFVPFHSTRDERGSFGRLTSVKTNTYGAGVRLVGRISIDLFSDIVSVFLEPAMTTRSGWRRASPRSSADFQPGRFCSAIRSSESLPRTGRASSFPP